MLDRHIALCALACVAIAGCRPPAEAPAAPPEPRVAIDPVTSALAGMAQRGLERRHPNARVILFDQVMNRDGDQPWVCGRYLLLTRDTRREQFFIVGSTELIELRKNTTRRWEAACSAAKPLPGGLDVAGAQAEAASVTFR
jgi:hypothetical protein